MFLHFSAVLRLRRKHGRCDSDNLSLPSTDDEDGNISNGENKNPKKNINTNTNLSSSSDDSEDSSEPYNMRDFPVETRTCIICHQVGCKYEHTKRKPRTLYIYPEEILEGTCIFIEQVDDSANCGDGPQILANNESPINEHDKSAGDIKTYKERLAELKEQLEIEYADTKVDEEEEDNCNEGNVASFAEDIKIISDLKSNKNGNEGEAISISSDSLEEMNSFLPEVFGQIDELYKDVVNEEAVLTKVSRNFSPEWYDFLEDSFISRMLSQGNFEIETDIEDYLEDSLISIQLSQWNFGIDFGIFFYLLKFFFQLILGLLISRG